MIPFNVSAQLPLPSRSQPKREKKFDFPNVNQIKKNLFFPFQFHRQLRVSLSVVLAPGEAFSQGISKIRTNKLDQEGFGRPPTEKSDVLPPGRYKKRKNRSVTHGNQPSPIFICRYRCFSFGVRRCS